MRLTPSSGSLERLIERLVTSSTLPVSFAFPEWCGKSTKITTPTTDTTTTDYGARTVATPSRVRASCKAPKR